MLTKGVYPYEYMDDWENFNETAQPEKEEFFCILNMEEIADSDAKRVCKDSETKKIW